MTAGAAELNISNYLRAISQDIDVLLDFMG